MGEGRRRTPVQSWAAAMPSHRHDRATSTLQRELARIVLRELRDPDVATVRVSQVFLSPDRRSARVLVAPWNPGAGAEPDPAPLRALVRATPFIRKALARNLRMRHVPELRFDYDHGEQHAKRIDQLLKRIKKRARKGRKGLTLLAVAAALQSAPVPASPALQRLESSAAIMGSEFRIACYAPDRSTAAGAITAAFDEVRRVDAFLSHYRPESELSRINAEAARGEVAVSAEMADLLASCLRYSTATDGAFDITVGALVNAWGFYKGSGKMPSAWALWRARRNSGYRHLHLDPVRGTVRFLRVGMLLDPGGIGKGYAVDRAVEALREYGIERALVSSGTSSIYALGEPPDGTGGWTLDLRGPDGTGSAVATVKLSNEALSTSGSYEKFFEAGGRRYGHILDPRTGRPAAGVAAVSVIAPRTIDTEAWATALFVNGAAWARDHPVEAARVFLCAEGGTCDWLD